MFSPVLLHGKLVEFTFWLASTDKCSISQLHSRIRQPLSDSCAMLALLFGIKMKISKSNGVLKGYLDLKWLR